jgi:AraC-like DNA-binding protein
MEFPTIPPSDALRPYVKYYWVCTTDEDVSKEAMYPSGYVELCIDISNGNTVRHIGNRSEKMPSLEVLGHLTIPTSATVAKDSTTLVTRFYPHASSLFFPNHISTFTNGSIDLYDILGGESIDLYNRLMEQSSISQKTNVLETFLIQQLSKSKRDPAKLKLIECICLDACTEGEHFNIETVASRYRFSERYIQKLFLDWVGITPKNFFSVQRFNRSLELIQSSDSSLTSIAYQCGYYDQAHFIKEFKSYTGVTPSQVQ